MQTPVLLNLTAPPHRLFWQRLQGGSAVLRYGLGEQQDAPSKEQVEELAGKRHSPVRQCVYCELPQEQQRACEAEHQRPIVPAQTAARVVACAEARAMILRAATLPTPIVRCGVAE